MRGRQDDESIECSTGVDCMIVRDVGTKGQEDKTERNLGTEFYSNGSTEGWVGHNEKRDDHIPFRDILKSLLVCLSVTWA